jgi:hypothetical protein
VISPGPLASARVDHCLGFARVPALSAPLAQKFEEFDNVPAVCRLICPIGGADFIGSYSQINSRPITVTGMPLPSAVATTADSLAHSSPCARGPRPAPRQNRAVEQRVAMTRLTDGSRIAYAVVGRGPVLVHAPGWLTHLELSWAMPPERALYESLAQGRTVVRYDKAGCGLSGAAARVPSMELELETLDAVVPAVGASRFDLYGASLGAAVAAAWTAEHPARVARLVLYGGGYAEPTSRLCRCASTSSD